jgi:hypothetical protein
MTWAFAKTGSNGGTIVGRLVSITMDSGHLCADLMRIIDLSTRASRKKFWEEAFGKYQSEMNSIPRSRLPTKKEVATQGHLISNRAILGVTQASRDQCSANISAKPKSISHSPMPTRLAGFNRWPKLNLAASISKSEQY